MPLVLRWQVWWCTRHLGGPVGNTCALCHPLLSPSMRIIYAQGLMHGKGVHHQRGSNRGAQPHWMGIS